jgi:hypothetical protein
MGQVRFVQTDGPDPVLLPYRNLNEELDAIAIEITAEGQRINRVLEECLDTLLTVPDVEYITSRVDDIADLLELVGAEHQTWLEKLWKEYEIQQEPLTALDGQILAEPAFWFKNSAQIYTCFGRKPVATRIRYELEDGQVVVLEPGQPVYLSRG